jgi:2,4-dienoyl-CoA reductase-like NADH-dependent reductase (Old Yellow Enzyme family)
MVRSATHEGMADEHGFPTESLKKLYVRMAKGEAGAIITGFAGVRADGKCAEPGMSMIDDDRSLPHYKELTDAVHAFGTPIILQIAHCGRQTRSKVTGFPTVAPSALRDGFFREDLPLALTAGGIEEIIDCFVSAIVRAKEAGFDGVQLHLAHGYLLSEFLSSHSNRRKDAWGGSTENKFRIVGQIFERAKERVGDFPILAKLNAHDSRKNGMRVKEAIEIARQLEKAGCAAIEVSCGTAEDGLYFMRTKELPVDPILEYMPQFKKMPRLLKAVAKPLARKLIRQPSPLVNYNVDAAIEIKASVRIPVGVVGGISDLADIKSIVEHNALDFASMSRAFIIEPDIVSKFKKGAQTTSKCIKCGYCAVIGEERPLKCYYGRMPS